VGSTPYIRRISRSAPVLVVGAGGHALMAIEVLWAVGRTVLGCVSNDGTSTAWLPVEMIGRSADAGRLAGRHGAEAFVAVDDNYARQKFHAELTASGIPLVTAISPAAVVAASAVIGLGTVIMPGAVVNGQSEVGEGVIINTAAVVDGECRVGDFSHVATRAAVAGRAILGRGVFVGTGAAVVPMVSIGDWAVVGAGAAVTASVAAGTTVVGVPARVWAEE
jgi:sugar O-acyltransferase (sialic acid O-acetyltransferase NeuD family)